MVESATLIYMTQLSAEILSIIGFCILDIDNCAILLLAIK